jgi:hypothetical protein
MNSDEQNIDVCIGDISLDISPILVHTIASLNKSMGKQQVYIYIIILLMINGYF